MKGTLVTDLFLLGLMMSSVRAVCNDQNASSVVKVRLGKSNDAKTNDQPIDVLHR